VSVQHTRKLIQPHGSYGNENGESFNPVFTHIEVMFLPWYVYGSLSQNTFRGTQVFRKEIEKTT
jgi:hypothetical protein